MLEQDYLMRIISQLFAALRRSWERASGQEDPDGAARMLDEAIGEATELDGEALLSLSPDSMASILQVSGTDPQVSEYVARSLLLSSRYHGQAGNADLANLRRQQAYALAEAYAHELNDEIVGDEELEAFFDATAE